MGLSSRILVALFATITVVSSEILAPPYFNLAEGRKIEATATCGVDIAIPKERFCRLTGASADEIQEISGSSLYYSGNSQIIAGQLCDFCVPEGSSEGTELQVHSAEYAIDGTQRWWQSPPLSRGSQFNDVNLTVDLGQVFHVAYVFIKMGNSPRPGVWSLERSTDNGQTWSPWQYFADSAADCNLFFGQQASKKPTTDNSVICTTEFSKIVPLEGGEIAVSLVKGRPGSTNFSHAPLLQEFTKATNIRLSLQRAKTLQGHLMQLQRQDPTVTRRYFYSVKDIEIGGRCVCNGHADACDRQDQFKLVCECRHNTCGDNCDRCCAPYVQKKWRVATDNDEYECEPCQCFGHSNECEYDAEVDRLGLSIDIHGRYDGGGVCKNCSDNTMGTNCDRCVNGYYRPVGRSLYDKDLCQPCMCDPKFTTGNCEDTTGICECLQQYTGPDCRQCAFGYYDAPECKPCDCYIDGTDGGLCEVGGRQCPCKDNYGSDSCGECSDGYWNFPECVACSCGGVGAADQVCDKATGQCNCNFEFSSMECDKCQVGYYAYPNCTFCDCDTTGTEDEICDSAIGQCLCKSNYIGDRCDQCAPGYYSYPECLPCQCDATGTVGGSATCNDQGQCQCLVNFGGKKCESCAPGYHNHPTCKSCDCSVIGSFGQSCNQESAQCDCRRNFVGLKCASCAPDFYNFPTCEACLCNPAGAMPVEGYPLGGCGSFNDGSTLCECKENVEGHICDQCKPGYYDLTQDNSAGCKPCNCHLPGTLLGDNMCDPVTGQCLCKVNVNSDYCQACIPGTFNLLESSVFGCEDCDCDLGGAISPICGNENGQCLCRPRITGRTCNKPISNHYFPTLHQFKYELEDGYNPTDSDSAVRFGFEEADFPGFSWRGFAVFSRIQPEVRVIVNVDKPSVFKLIFRFMNRNVEAVTADVVVTPEDPAENVQAFTVFFPTTGSLDPEFLTTDTPLVLNRGRWTISVKTDSDLNVDYLVLLPQAYYEGGILQENLKNPCMVPDDGRECLHYAYLDLSKFNQQDGEDAMSPDGNELKKETNRDILLPYNSPTLVLLDDSQPEVIFNLTLKKPGKYVFVVGYTSPLRRKQEVTVNLQPEGGNVTTGKAMLYECQYSSFCRQVVIGMDNGQQELDIPTINVTVSIVAKERTSATIGYIAAVPEEEWEDRMAKPQIECVRVDGKCVDTNYPFLPDAIKMEITSTDDGADLAKLDTINPLTVAFHGLVSQSYAIIVNYYQTEDVGYPVNISVEVNSVLYTGYFDASYCPNMAGCNGVVTFDDILIQNQIIDVLSRNAAVTIKPLIDEDANIFVDFIQMVPTDDVNSIIHLFKELDPHDLSGRYISECTGKDFHIDAENGQITQFCRSAVFSVTTEHNNGALSCDCDAQGSESFQCSEFGGQCTCKPNVIGRTCSACAQNYFGFPNCQPCNCPATCNAVSGNCECPKRTTGPQCDKCEPQTYGYDRIIGCSDCLCRPEGVLNGNLNCDMLTGACDCKPNVVGRKCDLCMDGYWNYPSCDACNCDPAGTTQSICEPETSTCSCKVNTGGSTCGECQAGTYNLEARNHEGCTKCFCFGITSTCQSSSLLRSEIKNMSGWGLTNANGTAFVNNSGETVVATLQEDAPFQNIAMYWLAPEIYLGNRITSYGGQIKYTLRNAGISSGDSPSNAWLPGPDIQITGKNMVISYELLSPILDEEIAVDFIETSWRHAKSGDYVTREQLMRVLSSVEELLIKANQYADIPEVALSAVAIDSAVELSPSTNTSGVSASFSSDIALTVEMCQCPPNYAGTSCEDCAEGFYRKVDTNGHFVCVPCDCNGHSLTCDRETGVCKDCEGNTEGDNCENCRLGYTGAPELGEECIICACPMPIESNNFARNCVLSPIDKLQTIQCDCMPGFLAPFCDTCGPGHYGDPRNTTSGNCSRCDCNGNADMSNPGSCDNFGGNCLLCLNNTQGEHCEECADFYWGDAIINKNCTKCDCDEFGTDSCDKETGECMCKPNVSGDRCDQCNPGTWGFHLGNGCSFCNCSIAATSSQCDIITGDCSCEDGATGKRCGSCLPQHWDFTASGCKSCECELAGAVGCSVDTGICQCLQGVTGEKCDRCDDRWVLIPERGCEPCDNCVHTLLDDTDELQFDIANASVSLNIINIGVEARKRLEQLNMTAQYMKMRLDGLPRDSLGPTIIDGLLQNLTDVQILANDVLKDALQVKTISSTTTDSYELLNDRMGRVDDRKNEALREIQAILDYIQARYEDILSSDALRDVSKLLREARAMLASMEERQGKLDELLSDAHSADKGADDTLKIVEEWNMESANLTEQFTMISNSLSDTKNRLLDLQEKAEDALQRSGTAEGYLAALKKLIMELQQNTENIKGLKEAIEKVIGKADRLTVEAEEFIADATITFQELESKLTILDQMIERLNNLYESLSAGNVDAKVKVDEAKLHADSLIVQAANLSILLDEASHAALKAANAYKKIVTSINEAMNASRDALDMAMKAIQESTDIQNSTEQVRVESLDLLTQAERLKNETSQDLDERLQISSSTIDGLKSRNLDIEQKASDITFNLNVLKNDSETLALAARRLANESKIKAEDAVEGVQDILDTLDRDLDLANQIPVLQDKMGVNLLKIKSKLNTIKNVLPNVTSLTERLTQKMPTLTESSKKLSGSISALRQRIETARATANRIKVALKSDENTTVEVRAPEGFVDSLQQQTELSLFFQTVEENGLLLYIGPKATSSDARQRRAFPMIVEYLAIELVNGHVVWRYNLGATPAEIISQKTYNDGEWHQVIAKRQGKEGELKVKTHEKADDDVSGTAGGDYNQLDLVPKATRIFAGGVDTDFSLPPDVQNRRFSGGLDDYSYSENQIRLGLWNFVKGDGNNKGTLDRGGDLKPVVSNSVRFIASAESYITINKGTLKASKKFSLDLKFTTLNKNGIIFFMGQDQSAPVGSPDYFKLYLIGGMVHATFQLGGGEITAVQNVNVADGAEHQVKVEREDHMVSLMVDNRERVLKSGSANSKELNLGSNPELHIGGIPKDSKYYGNEVANHPYFDGCVSDLSLNQNKKNILANYEAKVGTVSGCKLLKRSVTFRYAAEETGTPQDEGFVQVIEDIVMVGENFTLSMRIKTLAEEGILFYASAQDDKSAFSVALVGGKISVVNTAGSDGGGITRRNDVETSKSYNDGAWHHISVVKEALTLSVTVDDNDRTTKDGEHRGKKTRTDPTFGYYLGGIRRATVDDILYKENSPSWQRFVGCMSQVFIQDVNVDFAASYSRPEGLYADYSACPVPDPADPDATTPLPTTTAVDPGSELVEVNSPRPCTLPQVPNVEDVLEQGTRFGLNEDSRFEFNTIAGIQTDIRKELRLNNNVKFMVKTFASEGMIWFVGNNKESEDDSPDYSAIYLDEGKIVYKCNLGSGPGTGMSPKTINDGEWHSVQIKRRRSEKKLSGSIIVDEEEPIPIEWPSGASSLNYVSPIYVGGLNMSDGRYRYMAQKIGPASAASLVGCIDKIEYRRKDSDADWIPYGQQTKALGTQGCFESQEDGVFIPVTGGSLALGESTTIGLNAEVEVSVRPRSTSGVVLLVWGGGDYVGIELFEGKVKVNMNNGAGDIEVSVDAPDICDGLWRKIKVVKRSNALTLTVTTESEEFADTLMGTVVGVSGSSSADTNSPVYIGGIPPEASGSRYRPNSGLSGYVGCIRRVRVGDANFNMSRARKIGDVERTCPTT